MELVKVGHEVDATKNDEMESYSAKAVCGPDGTHRVEVKGVLSHHVITGMHREVSKDPSVCHCVVDLVRKDDARAKVSKHIEEDTTFAFMEVRSVPPFEYVVVSAHKDGSQDVATVCEVDQFRYWR